MFSQYCRSEPFSKACKKTPKLVFYLTKPSQIILDGVKSLKVISNALQKNENVFNSKANNDISFHRVSLDVNNPKNNNPLLTDFYET